MRDLSIIIPARNEMFLKNTVDDILQNIEADTEIIVVLDGQWPTEPIPDHERVTLIYLSKSIGQRAAMNMAARLSTAKYIMKCDAHCAFDKGFDRKMIEDMQDDITMVPTMYNLYVFDWVCECGHRRYQGPTAPCQKCGKEMKREMKWQPKKSPETTAMRFDRNLKFQYWSGYKKRQSGDLVETMSILGACFMLTREKYWELEIADEGHGSWGQQGTEVACKTWLSGGRLLCTRKTWFAHMFRTQGGDFGFPYPNDSIEQSREYSKNLWLNNEWLKAKHDLRWLIDKFAPVPDWQDEKKGIIYYTDNQLNVKIARRVQKQLLSTGIPIVSASLKPMPHFGTNIHIPEPRGYLTMFKQILAALEASKSDIIFFCEHDVLYHPSHFEFTPPRKDTYYYNINVWKLRSVDGHAVRVNDCRQLSGLCAYRELLIKHYRERVRRVESEGFTRAMGFEPGTHGREERVDNYGSDIWSSEYPNIDIRHDHNLTESRWNPDQFRNKKFAEGWTESDEIPGWGKTAQIISTLNQ